MEGLKDYKEAQEAQQIQDTEDEAKAKQRAQVGRLMKVGAMSTALAMMGGSFGALKDLFGGHSIGSRISNQLSIAGYRKSGIPIRNPKIAANITMMHERWLQTKSFGKQNLAENTN